MVPERVAIQRKVTVWFKGHNSWAALAVTLLAVLLVVGPLTLIGLSLVDDGKPAAPAAPQGLIR